MRTIVLLAALLLPAGILQAARPIDASFSVSVAVDVDATGKVSALHIDDKRAPESVVGPLESAMRGWEFKPAQVDGRPAASKTHVHLTLKAEQVPGNEDAFAVRIASASTGPGMGDAPPPRYPDAAIRAGAMAEVVLEVDVAADGTVTDVREHAVKTNRGHGRRGPLFVRRSMDAVRKWHFVPERVEGQGIATTVLVPINFCIATKPCVRMDDSEPAPALIADHPATKLKSEVVGRIL